VGGVKRALLAIALFALVAMPASAEGHVYRFFNWDVPGVPGVVYASWNQIQGSSESYNWGGLDAALARIQAPAQIFVTVAESDIYEPVGDQAQYFCDLTPAWVYAGQGRPTDMNGKPVGHKITGCDGYAVIPAYDSAGWREAYWRLVRAMGEHYRNNPQVTSVVVGTGLDSETQPIKSQKCSWADLMRAQAPDVEYRFDGTNDQFIGRTMQVYKESFGDKVLLLNNAPGERRCDRADYAATLGIGLKHAGMWVDLDSHQGYGNYCGSWDPIRAYSQTLPIWLETPYGFGGKELLYWSILAGLNYHPDGMNIHSGLWDLMDVAMKEWIEAHLDVTIADTPSVWAVMRDAEYPLQSWGSGGCSGHMGDWTFWMTRTSDNPRVWRESIPAGRDALQARQCRTGGLFAFDVADGFTRDSYTLYLTMLDWQGDLLVQWTTPSGKKSAAYKFTGSGDWISHHVELVDFDPAGAEDIEIRGASDLYIHGVEVTGEGGDENTPTPTQPTGPTLGPSATPEPPTATATATRTATRTVTATPTRTATATVTPSRTPTCTATPTLTETPEPLITPTATMDVVSAARALQTRSAAELGLEMSVTWK